MVDQAGVEPASAIRFCLLRTTILSNPLPDTDSEARPVKSQWIYLFRC